MKHTNLYRTIQDLKKLEKKELIEAVELHKGRFEWWSEKDGWSCDYQYPIVAVNLSGLYPNPLDVCVRCVFLDENKNIHIIGEDKEYGDEIEVDICDIFVGHVGYIIDAIPPTNEMLEEWFYNLSFNELENITRLKQQDFSPKDGFQEFVDACHDWWKNSDMFTKIFTYEKSNNYGT